MTKPIFRWTIGNINKNSLVILKHSIRTALKYFGDTFDWIICCNSLQANELQLVVNLIQGKPIRIKEQKWEELCISLPFQEKNNDPKFPDFEKTGSIWKLCPPRIDLNVHEITMDNDIVFIKYVSEIESFLKSQKTLIAEDCVPYYGRCEDLMANYTRFFNSGLYGLPPNFDFGQKLIETWDLFKEYIPDHRLTYGEEQAMICHTLNQIDNIVIPCEKLCILPPVKLWKRNTDRDDGSTTSYESEYFENLMRSASALHFIMANRTENHRGWKAFLKKNTSFL